MASFRYEHLAKMLLHKMSKHHIIWPFLDQWETAFLFPDANDPTVRVFCGCNQSEDLVEIDTRTVLRYGQGLLMHNHPNGVLSTSEEDWLVARYFYLKKPEIEFGVITPDHQILLYKPIGATTCLKIIR